jgi:hypothetical protein
MPMHGTTDNEWKHLNPSPEEIEAARAKILGEYPSLTSAPPDLVVFNAGADSAPIPPREWLLSNQFCRSFMSSLVAGGSIGKTAVRIAQLIALATGRPITGQHIFHRFLILSFEDDLNELIPFTHHIERTIYGKDVMDLTIFGLRSM